MLRRSASERSPQTIDWWYRPAASASGCPSTKGSGGSSARRANSAAIRARRSYSSARAGDDPGSPSAGSAPQNQVKERLKMPLSWGFLEAAVFCFAPTASPLLADVSTGSTVVREPNDWQPVKRGVQRRGQRQVLEQFWDRVQRVQAFALSAEPVLAA